MGALADGLGAGLTAHRLARQRRSLRAALGALARHLTHGLARLTLGPLLRVHPGHRVAADGLGARLAAHGLAPQRRGLRAAWRTRLPHARLAHHGRAGTALSTRHRLTLLVAVPRNGGVANGLGPGLAAHGLATHDGGLGIGTTGLTALNRKGGALRTTRHSRLSGRAKGRRLPRHRLAPLVAVPRHRRIPDRLSARLTAHGLATHDGGLGTLRRSRLTAHGLAAHDGGL